MKKLALILALMLIPCTAFGLQMLDDSTMDGITGQSGVHIALDDVQLFINIEKMAWIDCDGLVAGNSISSSCSGEAAAIYLNDFQIDVLNVNAILGSTRSDGNGINATNQTTPAGGGMELYSATCGLIPLFYDYGQTGFASCYLTGFNANGAGLDNYTFVSTNGFKPSAITIDATDAMPVITQAYDQVIAGASFGGIVIGLPTVEVYISSLSLTPTFTADVNGDTAAANALVVNNNQDFGTIYIEGITFSVLSGWLEIGPH